MKKRKLLAWGYGILVIGSIAEYNAQCAYGSSIVKPKKELSFEVEKFSFANEAFPYHDKNHHHKYLVYEKQIANTNIETAQMIHRSKDAFQIIEPILRKHGIPDDFKYLAVLESGLNQNIVSSANATGVWQLMGTTAQAMGLTVNEEVDERLDLAKSTVAICKLLKSHKRFFGTWTEALVAFNMGNTALFKFQKAQNNFNDVYALRMYVESAHVIYKIIAYKELFNNLEKYGYAHSCKAGAKQKSKTNFKIVSSGFELLANLNTESKAASKN